MRISKEFRFESSHLLPKHPGRCSRLHGHSFLLTVYVDGVTDPETGFVMDYANIKKAVQPLVDSMDHRHLGAWCVYGYHRKNGEEKESRSRVGHDGAALLAEIWGDDTSNYFKDWFVPNLPPTFYPTSENLIWWIGDRLAPVLAWSELQLNETCTSSCILTRAEYDGKNRQG